jgi:hypothetical protein
MDQSALCQGPRGLTLSEHNLTFTALVKLAPATQCDVAALTDALPPPGQGKKGGPSAQLTQNGA